MPFNQLDRRRIRFRPLAERENKIRIETDHLSPGSGPGILNRDNAALLEEAVADVKRARRTGKPVFLVFGAHTIKNGLAPLIISLLENGFLTHLATNGAGIIHDWEFSYQGASSEDVRENVAKGMFGIWEETGYYMNLALLIGAYEGLGYGESVGSFIQRGELAIPSESTLRETARDTVEKDPAKAASALDLLEKVRLFRLQPGRVRVDHPYKKFSVQAAAYRLNIPFTGHPMFGHDIIYAHPLSSGAAVGRIAERDFLSFADGISDLEGGIYLSLGSAVMSPMIFEKSLSMARNIASQAQKKIENFSVYVVDLAESKWDWSNGEPPATDPTYYLRYLKTFHRMGGKTRFISADNRDFLLSLHQGLLGSGGESRR